MLRSYFFHFDVNKFALVIKKKRNETKRYSFMGCRWFCGTKCTLMVNYHTINVFCRPIACYCSQRGVIIKLDSVKLLWFRIWFHIYTYIYKCNLPTFIFNITSSDIFMHFTINKIITLTEGKCTLCISKQRCFQFPAALKNYAL